MLNWLLQASPDWISASEFVDNFPNRISEKHEACQSSAYFSGGQIGAACLLQLQDLRAEWKSHWTGWQHACRKTIAKWYCCKIICVFQLKDSVFLPHSLVLSGCLHFSAGIWLECKLPKVKKLNSSWSKNHRHQVRSSACPENLRCQRCF